MYRNLFCCDKTLIIIKNKKGEYDHLYSPKPNFIKFEKDKLTCVNDCLDNNGQSSTNVKYNDILIGEWQFHNNRNCIKFRFYYKGLCKLLKINKS